MDHSAYEKAPLKNHFKDRDSISGEQNIAFRHRFFLDVKGVI